MTHPPGGLDRAAGAAARRLLRWASGRRDPSQRPWVWALIAEVDEAETGWDQLSWALGVLPLVLVERGAALGRTWRPRLLWLASAGGLGGLRVYGPGVACGIGMLAWSWAHRGADAPVPVIAAFMFAPCYVFRGLLAARRRPVGVGAAVGAVTAVVGLEVVVLGGAVLAGVSGSATHALTYLVFGMGFVPVAVVGAVCGAVGAALAHPVTSFRSVRTAAVRPWRR